MPRDLSNPNKFRRVVGRTWCYIHSHWEPIYENNFRVCFECGHSYFTERSLLFAHNEFIATMYENYGEPGESSPTPVTDVARILSCPACNHDW